MRDLNGNALLNNIRYNPNDERLFTQSRATLGNTTPLNTSTLTGYDLSGHTISQSSYTGNALQPSQIQETVWLGDTPVLILDSKPQQAATGNNQNISINYIHTDPLNTPRVITDQSGNIIWRWESDPYGTTLPTNAAGTANSSYTYNLRFAGQVYDAETKLHYNYYRDYDPATGRYIESDPLGLAAGVNTYAYVGGNPIGGVDPRGLVRILEKKGITFDSYAKGSQPYNETARQGPHGEYHFHLNKDPKKVINAYTLEPENPLLLTAKEREILKNLSESEKTYLKKACREVFHNRGDRLDRLAGKYLKWYGFLIPLFTTATDNTHTQVCNADTENTLPEVCEDAPGQ